MPDIKSVPQFSVISASTIGDNTVVNAVAGKVIRCVALCLVASGGVQTVRFESGASGTALTGVMDLAADGQLILPENGRGWFETAAGALLNLELVAATAVEGFIVYEEVGG